MILHIHNGDAAGDIAKGSSIPGEHFVWREALIEGPAPANVSKAEWRRRRAEHLVAAYRVERDECDQVLLQQEEKLASFGKYEEVLLWFEHDLFCQVILIYLLNWFAQQNLGKTKLSLVCIGSFPGKENFRGLGELDAEALSSLFPTRQRVTQEQFALAARAWQAYCSPDPRDIQTLIAGDTSALPFLGAALEAHLQRFPSTRNGLGLIENRGLEFIGSGAEQFADLFARFCKTEPIFGLGDAQFWRSLKSLAEVSQPLLTLNGGKHDVEDIARDATFVITDLGKAILKGKGDFVSLNGIDCWLGGVYLSDERNLWRWDEQAGSVVLTRNN